MEINAKKREAKLQENLAILNQLNNVTQLQKQGDLILSSATSAEYFLRQCVSVP